MNDIAEQIAHTEALIATHRRRQRVLESQRARFDAGAVPAQIVLELEDLAKEIAQRTAELRRLRPGPTAEQNPYLGLLTFQEADAERFFGRDALVAELVEKARAATFLAALGASGSGKSSVVRAGLIPALKAGAVAGSETWRYLTLRPGARPLDALAVELAKLQGGDLGAVLALSQQLASGERALLLAAGLLLDRAAGQRLVLVIDQAEELWTLAPTEPEAQAAFVATQQRPFIQLLISALAAPDMPLLVVLTMRADFLHRALEYAPLGKAITDHDVSVSPMSADELGDAIRRPAELAGGGFEPGLVDELIEQALGRVGALPLLEYTLQELWKRREPSGTMTWAAYHALGGIEGALAARADAILAERYTPEQQEDLRRLLLRLVQPGEGAADTRRRARLEDLVPASSSIDAIQTLLQPLTDERLLVVTSTDQVAPSADPAQPPDVDGQSLSADPAQPPDVDGQSLSIELSHEALIRAWPTFGRWIASARADLHFQLQLEQAAKEWQASGENADFLWSGLRLANVTTWQARADPRLSQPEQRFLTASQAAEAEQLAREQQDQRNRENLAQEQRRARTLRRILVALGALLIIAVTSAGLALQSRLAAQRANLRALALARAGQALITLPDTPERAIPLALAALSNPDAAQEPLIARAAYAALDTAPLRGVLRGHTAEIMDVGWSPDGRTLATASRDNTARLWDAASGQLLRTLQLDRFVMVVAWSPSSAQLATGSSDGVIRIWDAASGKLLRELPDESRIAVNSLAWSPDGRTVAAGYDNTRVGFENGQVVYGGAPDPIGVRVWDTSSGALTRTIALPSQRSAVHLAWRPDGGQLLVGSDDATTRVVDAGTGALEEELSYTAPFSDAFELSSIEGEPVPAERITSRFSPSAAWSPDGLRVIVGDADRFVRVWDLSKHVLELELPQEQPIAQVAWSPDGQHLLTVAGHARIYSALNHGLERDVPGGEIQVAAWSPGGRQLLTAGQDSLARLWALDDSAQLRMVSGLSVVGALAWGPGGRHILVGLPGQVQLLDAQSLAVQQTLAIPQGSRNTVRGLAWSPDGTRVAAGGIGNPTLTVWDAASGKVLQSLINRAAVFDTAWSPNGRWLAAGTKSDARIWDAASGQALHDLHLAGAGVIHSVAWSPNSQRLAIGGIFGRAGIWDAASGKLLRELSGHTSTIWALAWSPDGTRVVSASVDKTVRVWDAETGELLYVAAQPNELFSAAWSSDGRWIAAGGWGEVVVIEAASGSVVRHLRAHTQPIEAVAWSPDGSVLLSGGDDGTVRFWLSDLSSAAAALKRRACAANDDSAIRQAVPNWDWPGCSR